MDLYPLMPGLRAAEVRDLSGRTGFDAGFLGVPLPVPSLPGVETLLLPYTHFSVLMRLDKRLVAVAAVGIEGEKLMDLGRSGIPWRLDPRLEEDQQTGERVYARNDIDRGHLVRRASAVWGETREEAALANEDTFYYTNAAPQAAKFNQGLDLWLGLESYLLDHAAGYGRRLVVFTGPVFGDSDPVYRGVDIPLLFFKVAAFIHEGELSATGYVLDQTPHLDLAEVTPGVAGGPPPLGPFRTFQVPVADIEDLTGLDFNQLVQADRMPLAAAVPSPAMPSPGVPGRWRQLQAPADLALGFRREQ